MVVHRISPVRGASLWRTMVVAEKIIWSGALGGGGGGHKIYNSKRWERSLIVTDFRYIGKNDIIRKCKNAGLIDLFQGTWIGYIVLSFTGFSLSRRGVEVRNFLSKGRTFNFKSKINGTKSCQKVELNLCKTVKAVPC